MDEETILKIADLLKRRRNQRECAAESERRIETIRAGLTKHRDEIRTINQRLYELGYTGQ